MSNQSSVVTGPPCTTTEKNVGSRGPCSVFWLVSISHVNRRGAHGDQRDQHSGLLTPKMQLNAKLTRPYRERKPPPTPKFQPKVWSGIRIMIFGCPPDLSQNVVDALSCRRQSFRQVWYKSAVDCMRNANKCPKIPFSATAKTMKKWSGIHTRIRITTES